MYRLDLDPPAPTLAAWSRTARPVRIGRFREVMECERRLRHAHMAPWATRVDDAMFAFSAATLLVVSLVVLPLAAWFG